MEHLCPICFGRQLRGGFTVLDRHRHRDSYVAVVLSGGYEEAGDRGRHRVGPGQAILHGAFEAHTNRYSSQGAEVLNLALPPWSEPAMAVVNVADPDEVVRTAERDPKAAAELVLSTMELCGHSADAALDWPDELASALRLNPGLRLEEWARSRGLADATVSRGFRRIYGISPSGYRAQCKARLAWKLASTTAERLPGIALDAGFCDQAHMTRAVSAITGQSPGSWRSRTR